MLVIGFALLALAAAEFVEKAPNLLVVLTLAIALLLLVVRCCLAITSNRHGYEASSPSHSWWYRKNHRRWRPDS